jgi:hypothetical protein
MSLVPVLARPLLSKEEKASFKNVLENDILDLLGKWDYIGNPYLKKLLHVPITQKNG